MTKHAPLLALVLLAACASTPGSPDPAQQGQPATAAGSAKPDEAQKAEEKAKAEKQKQDERKKKQKELRNKQRELEYAKIDRQTGDLDRRSRSMTVEANLQRTALELERARAALDVFLKDVKPRELDQKRISVDQSTYRAEHSKDELNELIAMYEADEFAHKTKELVLKRGRRDNELADRYLEVAKKEASYFEQHELPNRERDLKQRVTAAELERRKAEIEADKARIEMETAVRKANEREADLADDIKDLQEEMSDSKSGEGKGTP